MNILTLCLSQDLGGLELYALRTATFFSKNHNVIVATSTDSKLSEKLRGTSIQIKYINPRFRILPVSNALKLAVYIDKNKIDIIHMHWGKDLALAALAKALSKTKPKLVYTRQMMITRYKNDFYHRFLYSQLDLILTITRQLEALCKKFIPGENVLIQTLYYGVNKPEKILNRDEINNIRKEKSFSSDDFIVSLFGRLEEGKGQHLLIRAIAKAKANNKKIKALIVGHEMNIGYRDKLNQLAEENHVSDNIVFNDFVDNPQELMQICDCLCLTTTEETFGLVLPEAMRAGIAVIGSDRGGVPEIIEHHISGLLFESGNADDLYRQITYLTDNPDKKAKLAEQGKEKANEQFNSDTHFHKLETILSDLSGQQR
ncbi:MAG: N-acetyl-alpha-D-glucosaminyl L-malate synthase BshA [Gammaproteobacteria bacterium]|nr:MAG: N-acetyl-alpha-D-glucosaminyl L-malate synthase BshA [Gammaproteobacteria bacterium]